MAEPSPDRGSGGVEIEARRHPFVTSVCRALRVRCGVEDGAPLLVGMSGGADSTALLVSAVVRRERGAGVVVAAHVHHGLRDDADDDADHARSVCEGLGVPCAIVRVSVDCEGNVEAAARRARYDALARQARERGAAAVAVGHHADDQLETILMSLARGAGPAGLAGMRWRRRLEGGIDLVRPALDRRRSETADVCRAAKLTWRRDPTNDDVDRARARLRSDVLPLIESLWPGAAVRAAATADLLAAASTLLDAAAERALGGLDHDAWPRDRLAAADRAVVVAGLRLAVARRSGRTVAASSLAVIADAIRDEVRHPRRFTAGGVTFELTSSRLGVVNAE